LNALTLRGVTKTFRDADAVRDLSLEVRGGSIFGLLGPNGAGKTTAIRMIVDILAPDAGEILVLGQRFTRSLKRRVGYLPEERGLYGEMTVEELLRFFAAIREIEPSAARQRIGRWLERVGLSHAAAKKPRELSKGMAQKIQFVVAVLHEPELLILDEPFSGFDPVNVELMQKIIFDLRERGTTILFSTHQMEHVEQMCDEICLMNRARAVLAGPLREIKRRFGANTLRLDFTGPDTFLSADLVQSVQRYGTHTEVRLLEGASAPELLRRAIAAGAHVRRFEEVEPSLHNIFISTVGGES